MTKKIIIAMDSFKGSGTSAQVAKWVEAGIHNVDYLKPSIQKISVADGGEGTVAALTESLGGEVIEAEVKNPLGETVTAHFGMIAPHTAVIEMAETSGINYINPASADVFQASTVGVGELILAAIGKGAKKIYLGLGGSGTNDGGVGMAQALGISFKNAQGQEISSGLSELAEIATIDLSQLSPSIKETEFVILADVSNPLIGEMGATAIYGPQKGIPEAKLKEVDESLVHLSKKIENALGVDVSAIAGGGAAGGLGAGLIAFTGAKIVNGISEILKLINFEEQVKNADLVITGEGRLDQQSLQGKAPIGIAQVAKKYDVPVIAIVGSYQGNLTPVYQAGIDLVLSVIHQPQSLEEALISAKENLINAGEIAWRSYLLGQR